MNTARQKYLRQISQSNNICLMTSLCLGSRFSFKSLKLQIMANKIHLGNIINRIIYDLQWYVFYTNSMIISA